MIYWTLQPFLMFFYILGKNISIFLGIMILYISNFTSAMLFPSEFICSHKLKLVQCIVVLAEER